MQHVGSFHGLTNINIIRVSSSSSFCQTAPLSHPTAFRIHVGLQNESISVLVQTINAMDLTPICCIYETFNTQMSRLYNVRR